MYLVHPLTVFYLISPLKSFTRRPVFRSDSAMSYPKSDFVCGNFLPSTQRCPAHFRLCWRYSNFYKIPRCLAHLWVFCMLILWNPLRVVLPTSAILSANFYEFHTALSYTHIRFSLWKYILWNRLRNVLPISDFFMVNLWNRLCVLPALSDYGNFKKLTQRCPALLLNLIVLVPVSVHLFHDEKYIFKKP